MKYKGKDDILSESPVYDSLNIPLTTKQLAGNVKLEIRTYFLVWETQAGKKIFWIEKEKCDLIHSEDIQPRH